MASIVVGIADPDFLGEQRTFQKQWNQKYGSPQDTRHPSGRDAGCPGGQHCPGKLKVSFLQPETEEQIGSQQRSDSQQSKCMGQNQPGIGQRRKRHSSLPAWGVAANDQTVERPKDPGQPADQHRFCQRSTDIDIEQVIRCIHVEQPCQQPSECAGLGGRPWYDAGCPVTNPPVHAPAAEQKRDGPGTFDCGGDPHPPQHKKFSHIESQRCLNQKSWIAISLVVVHGPDWPERAVANCFVEHGHKKDAVASVVSRIEIAGGRQWQQSQGGERSQQQPTAVWFPKTVQQGGERFTGHRILRQETPPSGGGFLRYCAFWSRFGRRYLFQPGQINHCFGKAGATHFCGGAQRVACCRALRAAKNQTAVVFTQLDAADPGWLAVGQARNRCADREGDAARPTANTTLHVIDHYSSSDATFVTGVNSCNCYGSPQQTNLSILPAERIIRQRQPRRM